MARKNKSSRRSFLKSGMLAGAAAIVKPGAAAPQQTGAQPSEIEVMTTDSAGSDYMVDVIKSLGFEYVCANPGSSFRGLQESIINYGGNKSPEFITNCHEESSVAMGHGYFKVEGKPLAVLAHGTVGLQHATMAIYNAWCDRVPVYIIIGNYVDGAIRRPAEWYHGAQDAAAIVRDFTKWDDQPASLTHFGESEVRAYKIAMTPPTSSACATSAIAESITARRVRHSPIRTSTSRNWRRAWVFMPKVRSRIRTNSRQRCAAPSLQ